MSNDFEFFPIEDFDDDDDFRGMFDDDDDGFGDDGFDFDDDNELGDDLEDDGFDVFDDDEFGAQLDFIDDDDDFGDDDFDDDDDEFEEPAQAGGGDNFRTLVIAMGALFAIGLILIIAIFAFQTFSNSSADATFEAQSTEIAMTNSASLTEIASDMTQAVIDQTATIQVAINATDTAVASTQSASLTQSVQTATQAVISLTETAEAIQQSTDEAIAAATQLVADAQAVEIQNATETAVAIELTLNPPEAPEPATVNGQPVLTPDGQPVYIILGQPFIIIGEDQVAVAPGVTLQAGGVPVQIENGVPVATDGSGPMPTQGDSVSLSAVQQTATALAQLFDATPTQADVVPTSELGQGGGFATTVPDVVDSGTGGGALPDTGLFDDVFGANPMLLLLAGLGLLAVIVVSRGIRNANQSE